MLEDRSRRGRKDEAEEIASADEGKGIEECWKSEAEEGEKMKWRK